MADEAQELRGRIRRMEALLQEVEQFKDVDTKRRMKEIVRTLMELHGSALEKILEHVAATGDAGLRTIDSFASDPLVESVLLLYGLHPQELGIRVQQAIERIAKKLESNGGEIELLGIENDIVRVRVRLNGRGFAISPATMRQVVEDSIYEKAPDVAAIQIEEEIIATPPIPQRHEGKVALPILAR